MKEIKVIFCAVEIAALIGVCMLAFTSNLSEEGEFFRSIYIVLCSLLAVVMQREQQNIDWEEDNDC